MARCARKYGGLCQEVWWAVLGSMMYKNFPQYVACKIQSIYLVLSTITHFVLQNLCSQKSQVASSSERGNEPSVLLHKMRIFVPC